MLIYNFKFNKKTFIKIFSISIIVLAVIIMLLSLSKIITAIKMSSNNSDSNEKISVSANNFTNFLRDCHDNLSLYVDKEVELSGFVYRMPDFKNNQFVLARTMLFNSDNNAVIVGILCDYNKASELSDYEWISIKGTISKGDYKGEMPVVNILELEKINKPKDEFVSPPSD